jgi:hypothetical protein
MTRSSGRSAREMHKGTCRCRSWVSGPSGHRRAGREGGAAAAAAPGAGSAVEAAATAVAAVGAAAVSGAGQTLIDDDDAERRPEKTKKKTYKQKSGALLTHALPTLLSTSLLPVLAHCVSRPVCSDRDPGSKKRKGPTGSQ